LYNRIVKELIFVASEGLPFVKTGGLADVVGALPKYLNNEYQVSIFLPYYKCLKHQELLKKVKDFELRHLNNNYQVSIYQALYEGITYYFLGNEEMFNTETVYTDNGLYEVERFIFFDKALLKALKILSIKADIIHCHDWQSALIPTLLKYGEESFFKETKTILTIHNLRFQGKWNVEQFKEYTGLNSSCFYCEDKGYLDGNMLGSGIQDCDVLTTVSPTYAQEILTDQYGEGLSDLLKKHQRKLRGILNGIDIELFNPKGDKLLPYHYDEKTFIAGKRKLKAELQKQLGLPLRHDVLLVGMVSRITDQKGFGLICDKLKELMKLDIQLVILGSGDEYYCNQLRNFNNPAKFKFKNGYFEDLAQLIYGASDVFLMPSTFEPCGLAQLIALRYGSLPLVKATGGLKDTIINYDYKSKQGNGFSFENDDLVASLERAVELYYHHRISWNRLIKKAMESDFSWLKSAEVYQELYDSLISR